MLKKLVLLLAAFVVSVSTAFAATVEVNTADQATLERLSGLGPVKSKAIIDERNAHGPFKDADDLANRVRGLGAKSVSKLEAQGLTVNQSSAPPTGKGTKSKSPSPAAAPAPQPSAKTNPPSTTAAPASSASAPASGAQESKSKKKKGKTKAASGV